MGQVVSNPDVARTGAPPAVRPRSPWRAAVLSLVTLSVYGFWWWWDLNRRLRALGRPARPWRALAQVTLGWLVVLPVLLTNRVGFVVASSIVPVGLSLAAVRRTAAMIAAAQRERGAPDPLSVPVAVGLAAGALTGAVAWFALAVLAVPSWLLVGVAWPLVAMALVSHLQVGFNDAVAHERRTTTTVTS
jgi:hypothetical protein